MHQDLNDVLAFTSVAEAGSFTAAARRMGMPKSSVSLRVARLERELGARLLERNTRSLRLTEVGARYHEHARRVLQELEQASATVASFKAAPRGWLRVSASVVLGQALLPGLLADYAAAHPAVQVFAELSNRRVDLLEEGFDLALRAGALPDSGLVARRLGVGGARLYASPAYLRREGDPARPEDLARHQLLEGAPSAQGTAWTLSRGDASRTVQAGFRVVSNDAVLLREAAVAGLGIASLPTFVAEPAVQAGQLRGVLPMWHTRRLEVSAVFPHHKSLSPALRAFVDLAAQRMPALLGVGGIDQG